MRKLFLGIASSVLMITGALAADPVITVEPAYIPDPGFDWDGFYMGVGVTGASFPAHTTGYLDLIAGANFTSGSMLFGVEGWIGGYRDSVPVHGWGGGIEGRLGLLATPDALLYVSGGGYFADTGDQFGTIGAGAEFAVTNDVTIDLEYKYWGWSNVAALIPAHSVGVSMNWHF